MVQAYVLIQTDMGRSMEVAERIAAVEGVTDADPITGPYDVIAHARARNWETMATVAEKLSHVEGVVHALPCLSTT